MLIFKTATKDDCWLLSNAFGALDGRFGPAAHRRVNTDFVCEVLNFYLFSRICLKFRERIERMCLSSTLLTNAISKLIG